MTAEKAFARARTGVLTSLIFGYAAFYLCRQNLPAAAKALDVGLGIDKVAFGQIASAGTLAYALGKFTAGPIADRFGGKKVFLLGLFGSAIATLALAGSSTVPLFVLLWSISRVLQSLGWAGLVHILPRWFEPKSYGTAMGITSTSYQLGGVVTPLMMSGLIALLPGWRPLFVVPALALIAVGLVAQHFISENPHDRGLPDLVTQKPTQNQLEENATSEENLTQPWYRPILLLLARPAFLIVLGLSFALTLVREVFNTWMPLYFTELGVGDAAAVFKSAIFPALGLAGTLAAGWYSDRYSKGRRGPVMTVLLVGLALSLVGLAHVQALALELGLSVANLASILVGLAGFCLFGPYSMVGGGVVALDFGGRKAAATASGLLDGVGYFGASLAGVGVAQVVKQNGWHGAWLLLAMLTVGSIVLCLPLWKVRAQAD